MNRLSQEKSPYLLQHKDNPVDWYPWCDEAFERAAREDKPVFLSVGYSTCHWCHVMAHESFEDAEVAEVLNQHFICIKVDREERPDIDAVYMRVCQAMTGAGGWPMTVLLTPEQKPFFAGTYFPKHSRYGQPGLMELLREVVRLWKQDRSSLMEASEQITDFLREKSEKVGEVNEALLENACQTLRDSFDAKWGGFGTAPKFPTPHNLLFLMERDEWDMVEATLTAMSRGGILDQIGGGFSRYSTDKRWYKPHFEKMLYDNALLILAYSEAGNRLQSAAYADIAKRTASYLLRELQSPEGGFYCGQDADSDGIEGKYYSLTPNEIKEALGDAEGKEFCRIYGISDSVDIPNRIDSMAAPWSEERLQKLYDYRKNRTRLHTDDKILLSWNAWTILALVHCGYLDEAIRCHQFIEKYMTDEAHRLYLRYRDGEAAHDGQLDDYAVYALALLALYRATFDMEYLEQAIFRAEQMLDFFADQNGGFFLTAHHAQSLIHRPKETYDGAIPSGNSVAAMVLEKLAQITGESKWRKAADRQMQFAAGQSEMYPAGHCFFMLAVNTALKPGRELIVCGNALPTELQDLSIKNLNVIYKSKANAARLAKCIPFTENYPVQEGATKWYLCENGVCRTAVNSYEALQL